MKTHPQSRKTNRYAYKVNHTSSPSSHRSSTQHFNDITSRKNHKSNTKKESSENPFLHIPPIFPDDFRLPLGDLGSNIKNNANLALHHKKQMSMLRLKNESLEHQISLQAKEIGQLKSTLGSVRSAVEQKTKDGRDSQQLKAINQSLQKKYQNQITQMKELQVEICNLQQTVKAKAALDNVDYSKISESNLSRRAEYAKNYEQIAESIPKESACQSCQIWKQQNQRINLAHCIELNQLKEENQALRGKQFSLSLLQEELRNKNSYISTMKSELQRSSKGPLKAISSFEGMAHREERHGVWAEALELRSFARESTPTFTHFKHL